MKHYNGTSSADYVLPILQTKGKVGVKVPLNEVVIVGGMNSGGTHKK